MHAPGHWAKASNTHHLTPTGESYITALVRLKNMPPSDQTVAVFNPALWIFVLLVTLGSILALALWLVIYRRHTMRYTAGEEPEEQPDPPATAQCLPASEDHSTFQECQHLHTGLHTTPVWHKGGGSDSLSTEHGRDWSGLKGSAVRQETVPLPATELVTTKTL